MAEKIEKDLTKNEKIENINYDVVSNGQIVGNVNLYQGGFNININNLPNKTHAEKKAIIEAMLETFKELVGEIETIE